MYGIRYRLCLKCHPLETEYHIDPIYCVLIALLDKEFNCHWSERDLKIMEFNPSIVRRIF